METLIINIPDKKSDLVKQILTELGVTMQQLDKETLSDHKKKLLQVSVWSDDDIKPIEEASKHFENFKPQQW